MSKQSEKNLTKNKSYNNFLKSKKSWKPLAVITLIILGGSVTLSVFAASPTAVAVPNPTPDCIYNKDAQSYNCNPAVSSTPGVTIVAPSPATAKALAATPVPDMSKLTLDTVAEDKMVFNINQSRGANHVSTMTRNSCLDRAARTWSLDMANTDLFDPTHALRSAPLATLIAKECGSGAFQYTGGNNGSVSFVKFSDPSQTLFNAWINDYTNGNRISILEPRFQMIGVGAYRNSVTKNLWVSVMYFQCPGACNQVTTLSSYN